MSSRNKNSTKMPDRQTQEAILSTISSLKEIIVIITGLTITNSIVQVLGSGTALTARGLRSINLQDALLFCLLIANVVRFYHGNMRHLDTTYTLEPGKGGSGDLILSGGRRTAIDFLVIFIQSLGFALLSFLLSSPIEFFAGFTALLVIDVVWFLSAYQFTEDRKAFEHQKRWTLNNTVGVFSLLILTAISPRISPSISTLLCMIILACNTIFDYYISWDFYFPHFSE